MLKLNTSFGNAFSSNQFKFKILRPALLVVVLVFSGLIGWGQVNNYTFSQTSGTYTALTSPTNIFTTNWDDAVSSLTIPFSFDFNGSNYTSCYVSTNGFITFGTTPPADILFYPISETTGYTGAISALGRDLASRTSGNNIVYKTEGTAPNRTFVIQWINAQRYYLGNIRNGLFNFQIRLSESSNVIQVIYGSCTSNYNTDLTVQVGLRGASNSDFNNRTTTNNWPASTSGTTNTATCNTGNGTGELPTNGLTYTWTPCTPPTITTHPSTASQTLCVGSSATALSVAATGTGLTYQWYSNTTSSNSGGSSVSGATSASYTPATSTARTLYYYCVVSSGGCSINSNVSGAITVVSPPVPDFSATVTNTSCPASADGTISVTDLPTALTFVRGDDDYVNLGSNFLSGLTQFTIEGWIKVNKSDIGNRMGLFGQNDAIEFGFISNTLIECYTPVTGAVQAPLTSYPNDNGWHHIAAVGTPTNIIIYIDGVQVGTGGSKAAATVYGTSTDAVKIGSHVYDPVGTNNGFTGQITKVGFYNTALSASDITNLAAGYTNYVSGGNLLAGYNFYEGTGTSLGSVTATGNGTFVNTPVWTELFNYTWTKTDDGSFSATTKNLLNISVGEYNIAVSNGSCQNSQSFTVGSVNTPSTDPAGITGITTICDGASTTLTVSDGSLGTGATWNWYSGTCGGTSVGTGTSILVSPATTTTYFVRGEGTCNTTNCASTTVTVNPIPTLTSIIANSTTICEGGSVTISINGLLNGTNTINYDFTINGSTTSASADLTATGGTATTSLNNLNAGSYTVEINSITVNGCTANFTTNNTVNWTVDPLPTATLSGGGTICNGASTTLSVDFTGTGPWEITTQRNGAEPVTVTNISVNPYTFDVSAAGTYTISAFNDAVCTGTASGSAVVTVIPQPTAGISGNNSPLCAGDNAIFTLTGTTGAVVTYNVNSGSNQTVTLTGGTATITINSATDDQTLTLVSVNNGTCSQSLSAGSTITVNPLPEIGSFINN